MSRARPWQVAALFSEGADLLSAVGQNVQGWWLGLQSLAWARGGLFPAAAISARYVLRLYRRAAASGGRFRKPAGQRAHHEGAPKRAKSGFGFRPFLLMLMPNYLSLKA